MPLRAGQSAVAITDHGVMYGAVDFYKSCREKGIKPIIGCEVYVAPRSMEQKDRLLDSDYFHLTLLVRNAEKGLASGVPASDTRSVL